MKKSFAIPSALLTASLVSGAAQASLIDRGIGAISITGRRRHLQRNQRERA